MIQQTSVDAYYSLDDLGKRQQEVLCAFSLQDLSNRDVSKMLCKEINQVTPRTFELVEMGLLEETGKKKDPQTGKTVIVWGLTDKGRAVISARQPL